MLPARLFLWSVYYYLLAESKDESQLDNLVQGLTGVYRPVTQNNWPNGTMSIGLGGTVDFPIEVVFGGHLLHLDEEFNFAAGTFYCGIGGATTLSFSGGPSATFTNADNIGNLQGWFVNTGPGGSGEVIGGGVDAVIGLDDENEGIYGVSGYGFAGPKLVLPVFPFYIHGNANYTTDFAVATGRITSNGIEDVCFLNSCSLSSFDK